MISCGMSVFKLWVFIHLYEQQSGPKVFLKVHFNIRYVTEKSIFPL